jgi:hypothetical protein
LNETELLAQEVHNGPVIERVDDFIPVGCAIFVANILRLAPLVLTFGWGAVLEPIYLVVKVLGATIAPDVRYGVFKVCFYELIKRKLTHESDGDLELKLHFELDKVVLQSGAQRLSLA